LEKWRKKLLSIAADAMVFFIFEKDFMFFIPTHSQTILSGIHFTSKYESQTKELEESVYNKTEGKKMLAEENNSQK
jgi:hypothetical protein